MSNLRHMKREVPSQMRRASSRAATHSTAKLYHSGDKHDVAPIENPMTPARARVLVAQAGEAVGDYLTEILSELEDAEIAVADVSMQFGRDRSGQVWAKVNVTSKH